MELPLYFTQNLIIFGCNLFLLYALEPDIFYILNKYVYNVHAPPMVDRTTIFRPLKIHEIFF